MPRNNVAVLSVRAQEDNLGDIEIRQKLFQCIADTGIEIIGYRGDAGDAYMEPFLGYRNCTWFTSMAALQLQFLKRMLKRQRLHFFMAPGPSGFSSKPKVLAKSLVNLVNIGLARLSGGSVHIVGRAYRGSGLSRVIELAAIELANTVTVRDGLSNGRIGGRGRVLPDLAFSGDAFDGGDRRYIAICVRGEPDLEESFFGPMVSGARLAGATPIFVTQVRRDDAWMRLIAERHGVRILEWTADTSHREQRERVESIYRASHAIVSNRLHGLIMGTMAGANPIPLISGGNTKLLPTLQVVFPDMAHVRADRLPSMQAADWSALFTEALKARPSIATQLLEPQEQLRNQLAAISMHLSGDTSSRRDPGQHRGRASCEK